MQRARCRPATCTSSCGASAGWRATASCTGMPRRRACGRTAGGRPAARPRSPSSSTGPSAPARHGEPSRRSIVAVICCRVPEFLVALARRADPRLMQQPLTLVGADGLVCAASAEARACGVVPALSPRQALARCPDARLVPLDLPASEAEHAAWLAVLARTGLPVEADGWGAAYVDARGLCHDRSSAQRACADLGHALREALGDPLSPALGWDTSKFTARAAAACAPGGRMRLVPAADETRFLNPLPLGILPLPAPALQQLDWL